MLGVGEGVVAAGRAVELALEGAAAATWPDFLDGVPLLLAVEEAFLGAMAATEKRSRGG